MKQTGLKDKKRRAQWRNYLSAFNRAHNKAKQKLDASLPLLEHINELRKRLFKALGAVVLTTAISAYFASQAIDYLAGPIGGRDALVSIEVTENIAIFMRVSLLGGLLLGMPVIVYQIARFVLPGLKKNESRWLFIGIPFASILFAGGMGFTWFVMIPTAVPFLTTFLDITTQVRPQNYFEFITKLMAWIGLSFEMPLIAFILAKFKIITGKQLLKGWRYALVGISILAATITPTVDPVNMGLVMLPLCGLYIFSIFLAWIGGRN